MTLPARCTKKKGNKSERRSAAHLKWVRGHACSACGSVRSIEAAHVRTGTDGGVGIKPSDIWAISLCFHCHADQHRIGEPAFEQRHNIDMKALALEFAEKSPALRKLKP